jgi:hypothetical protein
MRCPVDHITSIEFLWTIVSTAVYPLGIPLGIYLLLLYLKVPQMAKRKEGEAMFRQMLDIYVTARLNTIGSKIALYVGGQGGSKQSADIIKQRNAQLYQAVSRHGTEVVNSQRLLAWFQSVGISGDDPEEVKEKILHVLSCAQLILLFFFERTFCDDKTTCLEYRFNSGQSSFPVFR